MVTVWTGVVCAVWMTRLAVPRVAWLSAGIGSTFTEIKRAEMTPTVLQGADRKALWLAGLLSHTREEHGERAGPDRAAGFWSGDSCLSNGLEAHLSLPGGLRSPAAPL